MRRSLFLIALTSLLLAGSALAGHEPCTASVELCVTEMAKKIKAKGWVGIEIDYQEDRSLKVTRVIPSSPAAASGLEVGDRIIAFNGIAYATADRDAMKKAYSAKKPGNTITYTVRRGERMLEIEIVLAEVPQHILAQWIGQHLLASHAGDKVAEKP